MTRTMTRTAHSPLWWLLIGWWWAPTYWLLRITCWALCLPAGVAWSWVHSRSKDRARGRRYDRSRAGRARR